MMAANEPPSYDSGPNFAITAIMTLIIFLLSSFVSLKVSIDGSHLQIKFGYGIFRKTFDLNDIKSVNQVKNHWYYGWGIRLWYSPKMWIYNVGGLDAVEIALKNGRIYRIGTDEPEQLKQAIKQSIEML